MTQPQEQTSDSSTAAKTPTAEPESTASPDAPVSEAKLESIRTRNRGPETSEKKKHPQSEATVIGCEECEESDITRDDERGETVCENCGEILETHSGSIGASWERASAIEHEVTSTVTSNTNSGISDDPLGGRIDWRDKDGYGNTLSSKRRSIFHRIRNLDKRTDTGAEVRSTYKYAIGEVNRIVADVDAPQHVRDAACELCEELLDGEETELSGIAIESVSAAAVLIACDEYDVNRDVDEVSDVSHSDVGMIEATVEHVKAVTGHGDVNMAVTGLLNDACQELGVSDDVIATGKTLLSDGVSEEMFEDGSLPAFTGAAIYTACTKHGEIRQFNEIERVVDASVEAMREKYTMFIEATVS